MLSVAEALQQILSEVQVSDPVQTPLEESLNRVLAEDLSTPHPSPPFDKSMMDGFAVRSADFETSQPVTLQVLETITAGTVSSQAVQSGTASRIMTGAPIPAEADCVVPVELVQVTADQSEQVTINPQHVAAERNVLRTGASVQTGMPLMNSGTCIQPQHIAILAEFGIASLPTFKCPSVAVLATGDELIPVDQQLTPGHIRNSNEPMLVSQIQRAHAAATALGVARDDREDLRRHIQQGLQHDFLILSGGVSAGTLDLVPSELAAAGVQQVFHKIAMKPGKPLWFGQLQTDNHRCWVFGLPGNPVSSMVCFEVFVRTALRRFAGFTQPRPQQFTATLASSVAVKGDRPTYHPCRIQFGETGLQATPVAWGGSADLRSTADANGMCLLQPSDTPYQPDSTVPVILRNQITDAADQIASH